MVGNVKETTNADVHTDWEVITVKLEDVRDLLVRNRARMENALRTILAPVIRVILESSATGNVSTIRNRIHYHADNRKSLLFVY